MTWASIDTSPAKRQVGETGIYVHPIGIDGSVFGWAAGAEETAASLDAWAELGGTLVSTADHYAGGRSEIMIGQWLRSRRIRGEVTVATKVGRHPDAEGHSRRAILAAVDASLERLGVDCIDLLSLDGEDPAAPLEETIVVLGQLRAVGKVRAIGLAGHSPAAVERYAAMAAVIDGPPPGAIISEYNLLERRDYERGLRPLAERAGTAGLARLPLAYGYLTGNYRTVADVPETGMFAPAVTYVGKKGARVLDALAPIAAQLETTMACVAAAWVLAQPGIASTIVRARTAEQAAELIAAASILLDERQIAALDKASA